jgi:hypothetical protein
MDALQTRLPCIIVLNQYCTCSAIPPYNYYLLQNTTSCTPWRDQEQDSRLMSLSSQRMQLPELRMHVQSHSPSLVSRRVEMEANSFITSVAGIPSFLLLFTCTQIDAELLSFLHAHFRPGTSVLPRYPRSEGPSGFGECLIWTPVNLKSLRYRSRIGLRVERLGSSLRASALCLDYASRELMDDSRKLPLRHSSEVTNSNIRTMPWNLFTTSH